MIGQRLSHFRILEKIGEGGMGVVYRAVDENLDREVALKVLPPEAIGDETRRLRFLREARAAAAVTHPHIAAIHEVDEVDGTVFIAMELIDGATLASEIRGGSLDLRDTLRLSIEIAEALARAHGSGVIHRDLKPDNVFVTPDRHAKILDFGLAKLSQESSAPPDGASRLETISAEMTREGRVLGTAAYMSPEQARGLTVDFRTDLFSFGVVLYEMLSRKNPFLASTVTDTLSAVTRDAPPVLTDVDPTLPTELERIVCKCLEKAPEDRYQHADELVVDLRRLRRETESHPMARVSTTGEQAVAAAPSRRWSLPWLIGAGALLGLVALVLGVRLLGPAFPDAEAGVNSLAVMPLENLKDAGDPERLGRILQELIITDLSGVEAIKVFSAQRLYDLRKEIGGGEGSIDAEVATEVARRAGARTMLTGSLSQLGSKWILMAQLVNVVDGAVIKSERIDGSDLYTMADDLTGRIRGDLGIDGSADPTLALAVRDKTTGSMEAMRHYLSGVELLNEEDYPEAVNEFRAAMEIDPAFGEARYRLGIASWWATGGDASLWLAQDPESPDAVLGELLEGEYRLSPKQRLLARAFRSLVNADYEAAKPLFEELVERYPDEKDAWYGLGEALYHHPGGSRDPVAAAAFERALDLDPAYRLAYSHVRHHYTTTRQYVQALRKVESLIERLPDNPQWREERLRWLLLEGDAEAVDRALEEALARAPSPEERRKLLLRMASSYLAQEEDAPALRLLEEALATKTDDAEADVRLALSHYYGRHLDLERARSEVESVLAKDPHHRAALEGVFAILNGSRDHSGALARARDLVEASPEVLAYYGFWIDAAVRSGDEDELQRVLSRGLDRAGDSTERSRLLDRVAQAKGGVGAQRDACEYRRRSLDDNPADGMEDVSRVFDTGICTWLLRDPEEAEALFGRVASLSPHDPRGMIGLALVAIDRGDPALLQLQVDRLLDEYPAVDIGYGLATLAALRQEREDDVPAIVERGIAASGTPSAKRSVILGVADSLKHERRFEKAAELASRITELDPGGLAHNHQIRLADALTRTGRLEEATELVDHILASAPHHTDAQLIRGVIHMLEGDPASAERIARESLALGPDAESLWLLASSLVEQERWSEAENASRHLVRIWPLRESRALLAWTLVAGGSDVAEGVELAREAMGIPPFFFIVPRASDPSAAHALGRGLLELGDPQGAVNVLERAAEERPDRKSILVDLERTRAALSDS